MASWLSPNIVITNIGNEILSKVQAGIGAITVTRVVTGSTFTPVNELAILTALESEEQVIEIIEKETSIEGSNIKTRLTNETVTTSYPLFQIGIYVTHPDFVGEQLYFVAQTTIDNPDLIPSFDETPLTIFYNLYMIHSGTTNVNITIDPLGVVTKAEFEEFVGSLDDKFAEIIIDNLTSTETGKALSANQGRVLNDAINNIIANGTIRLVQTYDLTYNSTAKSPVYVPTLSAKARGLVVKVKNLNLTATTTRYFGVLAKFNTNYNNQCGTIILEAGSNTIDEHITLAMFSADRQKAIYSSYTGVVSTLIYNEPVCTGVIHSTGGTTEYSSNVSGTVTVEFYEVL